MSPPGPPNYFTAKVIQDAHFIRSSNKKLRRPAPISSVAPSLMWGAPYLYASGASLPVVWRCGPLLGTDRVVSRSQHAVTGSKLLGDDLGGSIRSRLHASTGRIATQWAVSTEQRRANCELLDSTMEPRINKLKILKALKEANAPSTQSLHSLDIVFGSVTGHFAIESVRLTSQSVEEVRKLSPVSSLIWKVSGLRQVVRRKDLCDKR